MASERYIKAIIYAAVLAWTVVLYVNHDAIHSSWLQPLSTVITVVLYAVMAFDLWLWKIPLLHGWFVKRPVIDGIWKVDIRSDWKGPSTHAPIPPIEGYMVIRQTFSTIAELAAFVHRVWHVWPAAACRPPVAIHLVEHLRRERPLGLWDSFFVLPSAATGVDRLTSKTNPDELQN